MKSGNENNNGRNCNNNNWLGFSLSPQMKMDVSSSNPNHHHHHHHQYNHQSQLPPPLPPPSVPTSFHLSPSRLNSTLCYGVGDNGGGGSGGDSSFHPPLSVMPLKSDGSLCIMEVLTRSQPEAECEDEGGATMAAHQFERETMALSLDSMYYQQLSCNGMYQTPLEEESRETQLGNCDTQIPIMCGDGLRGVKNWVSGHHSDHRGLDQQMSSGVVDDGGGASGSGGSMGCGDLQSLSLSMSPGSQSSCVTALRQISPTGTECLGMETKKRGCAIGAPKQPVHRKSIDTFGQRTSQFRGVTRHRWTGRYEAHLWDNSCKKEGQTRKGRQVYLGGYDMEEKAARAYDLAALKYWGPSTHINFPLENYQQELEEMKNMNRQEFVAHLRRKSSGFSRGASMYRGVTRHHQHGRWQARIGRVAGNKDLYLGTFSTQEEAAEAYDVAAIKFRGVNAVTNFDISRYEVERIMASNTLLAGDLAKRNKQGDPKAEAIIEYNPPSSSTRSSEGGLVQPQANNRNGSDWGMVLCQSPQEQQIIARVESLDEKLLCIGNYRNSSFSMGLQDLVGIDSVSSTQAIADGIQFSNQSSLVAAPLRAAAPISMAHFPVFAAWNDA